MQPIMLPTELPTKQPQFNGYPEPARQLLLAVRQLILAVATEHGLGNVEESIKWGEASFLVKGGSAIRIDWKAKDPEFVKLFFHCQTLLVETFKEIYPRELRYEGNRAVMIPLNANIQQWPLAHCILLALQYHRLKHLPLLGASPLRTNLMMQPILNTNRLLLRPFTLDDAKTVHLLAGDKRIAQMTESIPHPYPDGAAESWIAGHAAALQAKTEINFAIELQASAQLIGAVSLLHIDQGQTTAEIGYWIGVPYWGQGYATEAVLRLLKFAQDELRLQQFTGRCFAHNTASAKVLLKAGMTQQHSLSEQINNNGVGEPRLFFRLG